jgi:hypothetical protein
MWVNGWPNCWRAGDTSILGAGSGLDEVRWGHAFAGSRLAAWIMMAYFDTTTQREAELDEKDPNDCFERETFE